MRPNLALLATTVFMPLMGAIPDEAIMVVCGLSQDAQEQLNVAVGTLSGCVVMLLTLPWAGQKKKHQTTKQEQKKKQPNIRSLFLLLICVLFVVVLLLLLLLITAVFYFQVSSTMVGRN